VKINYKLLRKTISLLQEAFPGMTDEDAADLYDALRLVLVLTKDPQPLRVAMSAKYRHDDSTLTKAARQNVAMVFGRQSGATYRFMFWRIYDKGAVFYKKPSNGGGIARAEHFVVPLPKFWKE